MKAVNYFNLINDILNSKFIVILNSNLKEVMYLSFTSTHYVIYRRNVLKTAIKY